MQGRRKKVIKKYSIILSIGLLYLLWVLITDLRIPCIFNLVFKLECPGCGVTRMIASIVKLDFRSAFLFNPFLFLTFPIIFLLIIYSEIIYIRHGTHSLGRLEPLAFIELALALAFGIMRNLI
jgi:hypothetical protein